MRKYIYFLCMALMLGSCKEDDIDLYDQSPRLILPNNASCTFTDRDYVAKKAQQELTLEVGLMGKVLTAPRTFVLKVEADPENEKLMADLSLQAEYVFEPGVVTMDVPLTAKAPKLFGTGYTAVCSFDETNSAHKFDRGDAEFLTAKISVVYDLRPGAWDDLQWGLYSNAKYCFMMDHWGKVYDEMEHTIAARAEIRRAYEKYKREHGPLYDDEPEHGEIVFPE